jgi:3-hydroxyisobutyrate dehydrogenase-like beta-hydroxyacid dehydrogenase
MRARLSTHEDRGDGAMTVAVLGLGTMGMAVARRLLDRGYGVVVWNRTPGREGELAERGARVAVEIADAVAGCESVLTMLTDDNAVREVCLGDGGVQASLAPGAVLIDMSSVHPRTSRELSAAVGEDRFADAPILAGPATISNGDALFVVGGTAQLMNRLQGLFSDLGARWIHGGPAGTGTSVKLVFNLLFLEELVALSEAVALAQATGLDADLVRELFGISPLVPPGLHNRLANVLGGDHRGWFSIPLARKDLRLAMELGRETGIDLRLADVTERMYATAEDIADAHADVAAVVEAVRAS